MKAILNHFIMLVILSFFFVANIQSQTIQSDLKTLSKGADVIVTGKVVEQRSSWNQDRTRIYTDVKIQVDDFIKGSEAQNSVIITHPGGEVGEVGELYSHMPRFSNDEEVLVFAKRDLKDNKYRVLNGEDGKLTVYQDKATGEKVTSSNQKISTLKKEIKNYVETE